MNTTEKIIPPVAPHLATVAAAHGSLRRQSIAAREHWRMRLIAMGFDNDMVTLEQAAMIAEDELAFARLHNLVARRQEPKPEPVYERPYIFLPSVIDAHLP